MSNCLTGFGRRCVLALLANAANLLALASLVMIGVGFWLAWEPLGLIIPGVLVFACLIWGRLRAEGKNA